MLSRWRVVVGTGRAVVLITNAVWTGLVVGITGLVENWQVAPDGKPEEQLSETFALNVGIGVTVAV